MKRLQETKGSPVAYDIALRITTAGMTENLYQQTVSGACDKNTELCYG